MYSECNEILCEKHVNVQDCWELCYLNVVGVCIEKGNEIMYLKFY